jgi:hypothetical protein
LILLDSPDWVIRSDALAHLQYLPDSERPRGYRTKVIALFQRDAAPPPPAADTLGEGYGEYEIQLVEAALALNDPATLEGLAYLGVQVDRASQRFLATHGSASLPYLNEAWLHEPDARQGIMETWALMAGQYRSEITSEERIELLNHLLAAADSQVIGFDGAVLTVPLPAASPVIQMIAAHSQFQIARDDAAQVLEKLTALRAALSPADLHAHLSDWLQAICLNASGAKATACDSLTPLLAAGPSNGGTLEKFETTADFAFEDSTFTPFEHALLAANADSLLHVVLTAVPAWAPGVAYAVGDSTSYNGLYYQCRQAHTAQVGWEPPKVYALWSRIAAGETWAPQVMYAVGAEVLYQGVRYRAIQAHQSQPGWEPPNVPALWGPVQ